MALCPNPSAPPGANHVPRMLLCAALLLPITCLAAGVAQASPQTVPLLALLLSPWGLGASVIVMLMGGIVGVPVGTPVPTIEGIALSGALHWLPGFLVNSPPLLQNSVSILLLIWMLPFLAKFFGLLGTWRNWDSFSVVELLFSMKRMLSLKERPAPKP